MIDGSPHRRLPGVASFPARDHARRIRRGPPSRSEGARRRRCSGRVSGPAVIVIAEMPGITPKVADFARRVVAAGFTAAMPRAVRRPRPADLGGCTRCSRSPAACVSREFATLRAGRPRRSRTWLRALARHEHERCGGPGVGAVGMCFTGGFALGMMVDDDDARAGAEPAVAAVRRSAKRRRRDLGISDADLATVKERGRRRRRACSACASPATRSSPGERFETLRRRARRPLRRRRDRLVARATRTASRRRAHSVLTEHLVDEPGHPTRDALDQVLDLFRPGCSPRAADPPRAVLDPCVTSRAAGRLGSLDGLSMSHLRDAATSARVRLELARSGAAHAPGVRLPGPNLSDA